MYVEDWNIAKDQNELLLLRFNARNNQFIIILYTPITKKVLKKYPVKLIIHFTTFIYCSYQLTICQFPTWLSNYMFFCVSLY